VKRFHPVALPVAFGILAGIAFWYVPVPDRGAGPGDPGQDGETPDPLVVANATPAGTVWVFATGPVGREVVCDPDITDPNGGCAPAMMTDPVVLVDPHGRGASNPLPGEGTKHVAPPPQWRSGHVALVPTFRRPVAECVGEECAERIAPWIPAWPEPEAPRFGVAGHNATRVTFFAFLDSGEVLASNAGDLELGRFELSGDFIALSEAPWYLGGNATAPPGMWQPPRQARDLMQGLLPHLHGLQEGGIATAVLEDHPYAWAIGPLTLTLRVEAVLHAP
jgi:hypothetical protein